jgi:pimeloyl-ACP methyl ester carboxylesterase
VVPAEEFVELAGGRVHLLRGGAGEPVLFLHAAGGAGVWHPFHQLLAEAGFTVLAPDHPGFGKSDDFPAAEGVDDLVYH